MANLEREFERKLALCKLASLAESYTLLYCFRKERGRRWTSIEELPENTAELPSACDLRTASSSLTSSWFRESIGVARTVMMTLRIVDGKITMKMGIITTKALKVGFR
jgi:hypothetical protein